MQDVSSKQLAVGLILGVCLFVYGAANWSQHAGKSPPYPPAAGGSEQAFQQRIAAYEIASKNFQEHSASAENPVISYPAALTLTWGGVAVMVVCLAVVAHRNMD